MLCYYSPASSRPKAIHKPLPKKHEHEVTIPLWLALLPLVLLISMLALSVGLFSDNSSYGPNQIALLLAAEDLIVCAQRCRSSLGVLTVRFSISHKNSSIDST